MLVQHLATCSINEHLLDNNIIAKHLDKDTICRILEKHFSITLDSARNKHSCDKCLDYFSKKESFIKYKATDEIKQIIATPQVPRRESATRKRKRKEYEEKKAEFDKEEASFKRHCSNAAKQRSYYNTKLHTVRNGSSTSIMFACDAMKTLHIPHLSFNKPGSFFCYHMYVLIFLIKYEQLLKSTTLMLGSISYIVLGLSMNKQKLDFVMFLTSFVYASSFKEVVRKFGASDR